MLGQDVISFFYSLPVSQEFADFCAEDRERNDIAGGQR